MAPRLRRAKRPSEQKGPASSTAVSTADDASPLRRSMSEATRRVDDLIATAEKDGAEIRAQAEAEASRLIEARRAEAAEIRTAAERQLTAGRKEAAEIRAQAETDAGRLMDKQRGDAARVQADAEAEAGRYLAGRRAKADRLVQARRRAVSEAGESLLAHAKGLRERAEALAGELERSAAQIRELSDDVDAGEIENAAPVDGAPTRATKQPVGSSGSVRGYAGTSRGEGRSPRLAPSRRRGGDGAPEEALLRATQMAVEGNPRDEIDRTLRKKFGLMDTAPILDEILGREG
jgi:hypothetical protein